MKIHCHYQIASALFALMILSGCNDTKNSNESADVQKELKDLDFARIQMRLDRLEKEHIALEQRFRSSSEFRNLRKESAESAYLQGINNASENEEAAMKFAYPSDEEVRKWAGDAFFEQKK